MRSWRDDGLRIGFTNGVFDILHIGHVDYLSKAASHVDRLILGLNSDASVKRLGKGEERPINPEVARAGVLAGLESVAGIVAFSEDTPLALIEAIRPDVLFKGGDYDAQEKNPSHPRYIVGSREVMATGGEVKTIPLVEGFSTTDILKKLS